MICGLHCFLELSAGCANEKADGDFNVLIFPLYFRFEYCVGPENIHAHLKVNGNSKGEGGFKSPIF